MTVSIDHDDDRLSNDHTSVFALKGGSKGHGPGGGGGRSGWGQVAEARTENGAQAAFKDNSNLAHLDMSVYHYYLRYPVAVVVSECSS